MQEDNMLFNTLDDIGDSISANWTLLLSDTTIPTICTYKHTSENSTTEKDSKQSNNCANTSVN